jgi:RNA polymerase sigma-70 factor (sigma-E family)
VEGRRVSGGVTGADMDDYATLFARHHGRLLRVAELIAGDSDVAAEAVAEAFARTYPHWRRGRVEDVGAYLRRAVVHEIQRTWRRRHVTLDEARFVDGEADGIVERDRVWRALDALSSRQRTAVVLRYYEDLSEADIADAMGVPPGTVKSTLSRALDRLRVALREGAEHG